MVIARLLGGLLGTFGLLQPLAAASDVERLLAAAIGQIGVTTSYDPADVRRAYPGGDVPIERGVCSDVIIRAMRAVDVDLQREVHTDMSAHFSAYPAWWGLERADRNIDHRRVANLETWFVRQGGSMPVSSVASEYQAGDFVSWQLQDGLLHIGIVAAQRSADRLRPLIIHNIGAGVRAEDLLFAWPIRGHYRWFPAAASP